MRHFLIAAAAALVTAIAGAQQIAPVTIPVMPGRVLDVTTSDSADDNFQPSIIVCGSPGTISAVPALPTSGASAVVWTTTLENFVVPGLYVRVNASGTTASDCKRLQVET